MTVPAGARRARRPFAALTAVVVLVVGIPASSAGAELSGAPAPGFCDPLAQYFDLSFQIQFIKAFAGATGDDDAANAAGDALVLVLAPKLEQLTRSMAATAPSALRRSLERQATRFAEGTALLEEAGLTPQQVATLAAAPLDLDATSLDALLGQVDVPKDELEAAAAEFDGDRLLEPTRGTAAQRKAFERAVTDCGVVPIAGLDCDELVKPSEAADAVGSPATVERRNGTCVYVGSAQDTGDPAQMTVEVYRGNRAYGRLTQGAQNQDVPGLGVRATAIDGYTTFSSTKTCGRTIVSDDGTRTVVVALCIPDAEDEGPIATVTDVSRRALERVGS